MSFGNEYDSKFFKPLGKLILDNHKINIDRDMKDRYKAQGVLAGGVNFVCLGVCGS